MPSPPAPSTPATLTVTPLVPPTITTGVRRGGGRVKLRIVALQGDVHAVGPS